MSSFRGSFSHLRNKPSSALPGQRDDLEAKETVDQQPYAGLEAVPSAYRDYRWSHRIPVHVSGGVEGGGGQWTGQEQHQPIHWQQHQADVEPEKKILGMRRVTLGLTISNIVLVIALIVACVVLSQKNSKDNEETIPTGAAGNNQTSSCIPATTTPTTPDNNNNNPPTQNPTTNNLHADSSNICFNTNKPSTLSLGKPTKRACDTSDPSSTFPNPPDYTVPGTNVTFERFCGRDYPYNDIGHIAASTMEDCMAMCAQQHLYPSSVNGACVAAVWGAYDPSTPQGTSDGHCYLKWLLTPTREGAVDNTFEAARVLVG